MKHFTQFKLFFPIFFISLMICTGETLAQPSTANYAFTHATNGSLTDMTGATVLIGPNQITTTSSLVNIGFEFVFMGTPHTTFSVSARGVISLGIITTAGNNNLNTTFNLPIIAPFWEAMGTSANGNVTYRLDGTAPNRKLVVQWLNLRINQQSTGDDGTFQLILYETSSKIEFVYGSMNVGTGVTVAVTASIGFSVGNTNDKVLSVTDILIPSITTLSGSVNNNLVNTATAGPITGLNSSVDGERVIYKFTPPSGTPDAPTNLTFTNIGDNSLTLNWTDNAANESAYLVENVNDGIIYPFLPANSTFFEAANLSLQTNYTFRVYAVTEAAISPGLEGSEATTNDNNLLTSARYSFSHSTDGTLTDMTGATEVIGADNTIGTVGDIDIGFDFYFMSQRHSKFGVTARGVFRFGEGTPSNTGTNTLNTTASNLLPVVTPFWDNIGTSSTGAVRYKLTGIAPDRVLTIEWFNMKISQTSTTADGTFQLRLYENSLKIEFVYGEMNIGAGSAVVTASIGFSTGNANNNLLSVRSISPAIVSYVTAGVNNNLVNSSEAGPIAGLHSTSQGERVVFSFTPPPLPDPPASLTFNGVGPTAMSLNWTAGSGADYYEIYKLINGIDFTFEAATNATAYNASDLTPGTNYTWRIFSVNLTGPSTTFLQGSQTTSSDHNFISGLKTVGPSADFATLTEAFNTIGLSGAAILELQPGYNPINESYPISIKDIPGTSDTNTLTIRPAAGVAGINFESDGLQTFKIDSTSYVTIDGRPGGVLDRGSSSEITISNTNTSGNAILFINGASNNAIKYCNIRGVNTNEQDGAISISGEGGLSGNDNITIDNCEVRDGVSIPTNLIFVGGGGASLNDSIIITNCRLFNALRAAVHINSSGNSYVISGNSIYRTTIPVTLSGQNFGIRFSFELNGNSHTITDNFIGGSDINCGGNSYIANGIFWGIDFAGSYSLIHNNTIQNISKEGGVFYGIEVRAFGGTNNLVTDNTIGHNTTPNSITISGSGPVYGLRMGTGESIASGNLIANLTSTSSTGPGSTFVTGMDVSSSFSNKIIYNNVIHSLFANSTNSLENTVTGIASDEAFNGVIQGNIIKGLFSVPGGVGTANTTVIGIGVPGTAIGLESVITGNKIYDLSNASSGTAPNIFGIMAKDGNGTIANNQIYINNGGSPNPMNIRGINVNVTGTDNVWDVFYNSVNIGGEDFGSLSSSAFYKQNTNTVNLRNNLFYNGRTGSGGHYAVGFGNNTNITSDYNLFVGTSNVALWGATPYNFADYKTNSGLDGFSYSTDPTTVTTANLFTDASNGNLNINASNNAAYYVDGKGIAIEGVSGDYTDSTGVRNTLITQGTTDIGSDEFEYTGTIPDLTASGPPALNSTTMYSFAGRELGSIVWGNTGTVPSSLTVKYNSGVNPPGALVGEYSKAWWDFISTGGAGYTYDITLNYTPAILFNIANEDSLKMAKRESVDPWLYLPGATVNIANKTVMATGLNSFSEFTLTSSEDPLPVELTSFTASIDRRDVYLSWSTASEINNSGFDVERKAEGTEEWSRISFIEGNGTTSETKNYTFTDRGLNTGKYNYRLKQIDYNGNFEYFNLSNEVIIGVPDKYNLSQNYPNPFNPITKINFDLPFDSRVTMKIFDITGREIATLVNDVQPAGYYTVTFDAKNIASGMYFYRIIAEGGNQQYVMTKKMAVIK